MYDFIKGREGDLWTVCYNLVQATSVLVTPKAAKKGVQAGQMGEQLTQDGRLVVLGFSYNIEWAAAGKGFSLSFRQHNGSPASGDSVERVFHKFVSGATAGFLSQTVAPVYIEADKGAFSPLANASELNFTQIAAPEQGWLIIWGLHYDGSDPPHSKIRTYSPVDYNTGT